MVLGLDLSYSRRMTSKLTRSSIRLPDPTREQIAALAHELWRERGSPEGSDLDIWLEAERQLRGVPPKRAAAVDSIPADPANSDPDSDPALASKTDQQLRDFGGRPAPRSVTDYDV
jgi:hypothetical protein